MKAAALLLFAALASASTGCHFVPAKGECVSRGCEGTFRPKPGALEKMKVHPVDEPLPPGVIPVAEIEFPGGLFTGCGDEVREIIGRKAAALGLDGVAGIHSSTSGSSQVVMVSQSGTLYDSASVSTNNPSGMSGVGSGGPPAAVMASGPTVYCRGVGYLRP